MTAIIPFNNRARVRNALVLGVLLGLGVAGVVRARLVYGYDQDVQKLNRFVQTSGGNTPAAKAFREGRDLIERENWPQAAEKFNSFVSAFPKDRDVDAALYWYAYALQKQDKKEQAAVPLLRLIKYFPSSSWRREAETMLVVIGRRDAVQQALDQNNCEIKILALQSLFQANEDRAISFVGDVLKSTSTDCPGLKSAAVSLLGSQGGPRAVPLLLQIARSQSDMKLRLTAIKRLSEHAVSEDLAQLYDADRTKEVRAQILRALSEMDSPRAETKLIEVARSNDDSSLRQLAIRYLGGKSGSTSLDELIRLWDADRTLEIRTQVLRALSERDDPRAHAKLLDVARNGETPELRIEAIRRLGDRGGASLEDLLRLYTSETNVGIKQGLIRAFSETNDPRALAKLHEIARSADMLDLRVTAIRRLGERNDEQTVEQLVSMYDAEPNVQVKAMLIRSFGDSNNKSAVRKLMAIARSEQSIDLRKLAVRQLGESKDPEALKFLEDLLR
jgi:HEAT repeat protein